MRSPRPLTASSRGSVSSGEETRPVPSLVACDEGSASTRNKPSVRRRSSQLLSSVAIPCKVDALPVRTSTIEPAREVTETIVTTSR